MSALSHAALVPDSTSVSKVCLEEELETGGCSPCAEAGVSDNEGAIG